MRGLKRVKKEEYPLSPWHKPVTNGLYRKDNMPKQVYCVIYKWIVILSAFFDSKESYISLELKNVPFK